MSFAELSEYRRTPPPRSVAALATAVLGLRRAPAVIVIRDDVPLFVASPHFTTLEVMPTSASASTPHQSALPLLPQRGVLPRDPARGEGLQSVALKAFSYNVPRWLDDDFVRSVERLGYSLRVDTEESGRWNDFSDVDVVLCTHPDDLDDERRKPPTKLIAAWSANVIPICGDYIGYREIGDATTMVIADRDADGYLEALRRLRDDPSLVAQVRASMPEAASRFSTDRVIDGYVAAIARAPRAKRHQAFTALCGALAVDILARVGRLFRRARRTSPAPI
ncbi:glycosyltransferase [Microbacterium profundi]